MICTSCGATIADKAIVCYRCGAPTALPATAPTRQRPRGARPLIVLAIVLIVVLAAILVWIVTA